MGIEDSMRRAGDEVAGRAKQVWGDLTDNERLEAEGRAQHTSADDDRIANERFRDDGVDETRLDRRNDGVGDDLRPNVGDDGSLRDALRDDMGQGPDSVAGDPTPGTPGDDGTLRDNLRDDMGQGLHGHATPRRDHI
ncbi:CsbD family protein [Tessaracoccus sp. G1721]